MYISICINMKQWRFVSPIYVGCNPILKKSYKVLIIPKPAALKNKGWEDEKKDEEPERW